MDVEVRTHEEEVSGLGEREGEREYVVWRVSMEEEEEEEKEEEKDMRLACDIVKYIVFVRHGEVREREREEREKFEMSLFFSVCCAHFV